jgi:hypothetical protein
MKLDLQMTESPRRVPRILTRGGLFFSCSPTDMKKESELGSE